LGLGKLGLITQTYWVRITQCNKFISNKIVLHFVILGLVHSCRISGRHHLTLRFWHPFLNCLIDNRLTFEQRLSIHSTTVMSAGGYGHVPLPLIKGELSLAPPPVNYSTTLGFWGSLVNGQRRHFISNLRDALTESNISFQLGHGKHLS
jgi:hypothetical protein